MNCILCYEVNAEVLKLNGDKTQRFQISSLLQKYLPFCFDVEPTDGGICEKCWSSIKLFHEFYTQIEEIHQGIPKNRDQNLNEIFHKKDDRVAVNDLLNGATLENDLTEDFAEEVYEDSDDQYPVEQKNTRKAKSAGKKSKPRSKESGSYPCDICQLDFLSLNKLQRHRKRIHFALAFKCNNFQCVESFETAEQLKIHIAASHHRSECPHCQKKIISSYLTQHIKLRHDIDQRIVCDLCGKVSNNKHVHKYHYRQEHDTLPKLQCEICGEWLKHKDTLRMHMSVRHIQQPQTCSICGKVSPNRKALAKHKKIHLVGTKEQFKCIVCGRGFRDRTKLKEHSYIHSGVTDAYRCNYCEKTFRFGSSMYAHRKKMHPMEMAAMASEGVNFN